MPHVEVFYLLEIVVHVSFSRISRRNRKGPDAAYMICTKTIRLESAALPLCASVMDICINNNNNSNNDHYVSWGRSILGRGVLAKEKRYLQYVLGGGCSKLSLVTIHSQLSRPTTLRHYTSKNTDCEGGSTLCNVTATGQSSWILFCIDAYFPWVPRSVGRQSGDPQARVTINGDQII